VRGVWAWPPPCTAASYWSGRHGTFSSAAASALRGLIYDNIPAIAGLRGLSSQLCDSSTKASWTTTAAAACEIRLNTWIPTRRSLSASWPSTATPPNRVARLVRDAVSCRRCHPAPRSHSKALPQLEEETEGMCSASSDSVSWAVSDLAVRQASQCNRKGAWLPSAPAAAEPAPDGR